MAEPVVFGRYLLLDRIAAGGMAEVYRAKSYGVAGFEKLLVIKKILPHLSQNKRFVSMFIKEAKIAVTLTHKSIIQVFDLGKVGEDYYIAMEFLHGKDLRQITRACAKKRIPLPLPIAVNVVAEVVGALDYAHRRRDHQGEPLNIIHMDVSPQNVLVSFEGDVKLGDFGIAHAVGGEGKLRGGVLRGKYAYMSPEMASGKPVDQRTDLFSAGVILWELITGRRLFWKPDELKTIENVRRCQVSPPSETNPQVPPNLDRVAVRALAKDPDKRYQSSEEMRADLTEVLFSFARVVDSHDLSRFMRQVFAKEAAQAPGSADIANLITDVERLRKNPSSAKLRRDGQAEDVPAHGDTEVDVGSQVVQATRTSATAADVIEPIPPTERLDQRTGFEPVDLPEDEEESVAAQAPPPQVIPTQSEIEAPEPAAEFTLVGVPVESPEVTISGERKRVVIVSSRIDIGKDTDPAVRGDVQESLERTIENLDGTMVVNSQGFLAYFGVPRAHEDDVERAIVAGREVLKTTRRAAARGAAVRAAVALHIGTLAVESTPADHAHNLASDAVPEVSGAPIVVAERLGANAPPWKIIGSRAVSRSAGRGHEFVRIEPDRDPEIGMVLERYELIDNQDRPATVATTRIPLVGRSRELGIIRNVLRKVQRDKGQILALIGEAGVGKSRLVYELGTLAADKHVGWYRARAESFGVEPVSGSLFAQLLQRICGVHPDDSTDTRRDKVARLAQLGLDPAEIHLVGQLVGANFDEIVALSMDEARRRESMFDAVKKIFEQLARDRPLILVFEDLQYADDLSRELLQYILPGITDSRTLVILSFRPLFRHRFWELEHYNQIALKPLSPKDSVEFLRLALDVKTVPKKLSDVVLDTAGGNPLFLEELASALLRSKTVERKNHRLRLVGNIKRLEVPATLRATVTARLDRVSGDGKRALQIGAVLGRRFPYRGLSELAGGGVDGVLIELQRDGFLLEVADGDELMYEFRHPMVREVAYHSLPPDARKRLHRLAAECILRGAEEDDAPVEALAHHYERAEAAPEAVEFLERTGDLYARDHRCASALSFYRRARDLAAGMPANKDTKRMLLELALKIGRMAMREEQHEIAEDAFRAAEAMAQEISDYLMRGWALKELGDLYRIAGEYDTAAGVLEGAKQCAEDSGDPNLLFEVLEAQGNLHMFSGRMNDAERTLERALTVARRIGSEEAIARALNDLGMLLDREGRHVEAEEHIEQAVDYVRRGEDQYLAARVLNNAGAIFAARRDIDRAHPNFEESLELNRKIGFKRGVVVNLHNLGELHWREGDAGRAQYYFAESEALSEDIGWRPGVVINQIFLGFLRAAEGRVKEGQAELEDALSEADNLDHREAMAMGRFLLARLHHDTGNLPKASVLIIEAKKIAAEIGLRELLQDISAFERPDRGAQA